jgi:hypothetical protein
MNLWGSGFIRHCNDQCFHADAQNEGNPGDVADGNVAFAAFDRADVVGLECTIKPYISPMPKTSKAATTLKTSTH